MEATMTASVQAIVKAVEQKAKDTVLVAPYGKGTIAISKNQQAIFDAAFKSGEAVAKVMEKQVDVMRKTLLDIYGSVPPTFAQYRADHAALKVLAELKGLVDNQWVRKPYNAALIALYGKLPESDSEAAKAKREQRAKAVAEGKAAPKAGAKKGETAQRSESESETIEQFIAKHGLTKVLQAAAHILAERRESKLDATTLQAVAKKYDPYAKAGAAKYA